MQYQQILFWVFLASLPACYLTAAPAGLSFLCYAMLFVFDKIESLAAILHVPPENKAQKDLSKDVEELRSEVNALNLRAGLGKRT